MDSEPLVSIGVPVKNGGAYLEETLRSLINLDYGNLEIIVSNNCSTDNTRDIIDEIAKNDARVTVFHQPEPLDAINNFIFVLDRARGPFFCWNAHDDLRSPGGLAVQVEALKQNPELICVMTDVVNFVQSTGQTWVSRLEEIRLERVQANWPEVRRLFFSVPISNVYFCVYGLYRIEFLKRVILDLGLPFYANTEIPMMAQVALLGKIASVESEGFRYRRHEESVYHREVASEPEGYIYKRRRAIRWYLVRLVGASGLSLAEKKLLIFRLIAGETGDQRKRILAPLTGKVGLAGRWWSCSLPVRVFRKMKSVFKKFLSPFYRYFKYGPSWKERQVLRSAPLKERERIVEELLESDETSAVPAISVLLDRERKRLHLAKTGWKFEQPKRLRLIQKHGISCLLDCGANCGQYVEDLMASGWSGRVFSFEPVSDAYALLAEKSESVSDWKAYPFALGAVRGEAKIGVAGNSFSSSLLEFSEEFVSLRPDAKPVRSEVVAVRTLDEFVAEEGITFEEPTLLKLDVQGGEIAVLEGAAKSLEKITMIQCELALIPSYENGATFGGTRDYLRERGFVLAHIIDGHFNHETGELREVDGIFLNANHISGRLDK